MRVLVCVGACPCELGCVCTIGETQFEEARVGISSLGLHTALVAATVQANQLVKARDVSMLVGLQ